MVTRGPSSWRMSFSPPAPLGDQRVLPWAMSRSFIWWHLAEGISTFWILCECPIIAKSCIFFAFVVLEDWWFYAFKDVFQEIRLEALCSTPRNGWTKSMTSTSLTFFSSWLPWASTYLAMIFLAFWPRMAGPLSEIRCWEKKVCRRSFKSHHELMNSKRVCLKIVYE